MDDPAIRPAISTGSILQLRCSRCGSVNTYKRELVSVDALNDARKRLARMNELVVKTIAVLESADVDCSDVEEVRRKVMA